MAFRIIMWGATLLCAALVRPCFAQTNKGDSPLTIMKLPNNPAKVDSINRLVMRIREGDNIVAMELAIKAKAIAQAIDYKKGLAGALANIGWI